MSLMDTILRRKPVEAVITQAEHSSIVRSYQATKRRLAERLEQAQESAALSDAAFQGVMRDKLGESERAKLAESRVNSLLDEIEALKPDALKYRERCRRDREAAAAKRKTKQPA